MILKPINAIKPSDLDALIAGGRPEGTTLDYKSELPGGLDDDKRKFLYDVAAMANTRGGDIIYGMEEEVTDGRKSGIAKTVVGVAPLSRDAEQLRLDSMIRTGIEPRIPGIDMQWVEHPSVDRQTLVLRVPRSLLGPHMVTYKGASKFYGRATNGNFEMDVRNIRSAFDLSGDLGRRLREFKLGRIIAAEHEEPHGKPKMILHIVPIAALELGATVDLSDPPRVSVFGTHETSHEEYRHTVDGFIGRTPNYGSVLIFREGAIEAVETNYIAGGSSRGPTIPSGSVEEAVVRSTTAYVRALERLGATPPAFVSLSLLGVKDRQFGVTARAVIDFLQAPVFDRSTILLPDVLIDSFSTPPLWSARLQPLIDSLWQAAGLPYSRNYNPEGLWLPGRGRY